MIASICSEPKVLEVMRIVNIFISIIRIVVPILLIFVLIFKLISAITSNDNDSLAKVKKTAITNIVAAVIIFILPTLINLIVKITFPNNDYNNCLNVKSKEDIQLIYIKKAEALVSKAEETLDINDYNNAMLYLSNIKDKKKKDSLIAKLDIAQDNRYVKSLEVLLKKIESNITEDDLMTASQIVKRINKDETRKKYEGIIAKAEDKFQESVVQAEGKDTTGSLPGGDTVKIPPGERPITQYVNVGAVNKAIAKAAKNNKLYTREAVVAVAKTLINTLEASNYYIPYQLGGMYHRGNLWGINPNWGTLITHNNRQVLSGLDCRNFVNWTFKQAGLSLIRGFGYEGSKERDMDNRYSSIGQGRPGDVIDANPHIMLIVSNNGSSYTVAESNGVGRVRLYEFKFADLAAAGYMAYNMDAVYDNTGKYCSSTSGYRAYSGSCHIPEDAFPDYYGD